MVWIPVNGQDEACRPSTTAYLTPPDYLAGTVPETENADLRAAFLANGPEAVEYSRSQYEVRLQPVKNIS